MPTLVRVGNSVFQQDNKVLRYGNFLTPTQFLPNITALGGVTGFGLDVSGDRMFAVYNGSSFKMLSYSNALTATPTTITGSFTQSQAIAVDPERDRIFVLSRGGTTTSIYNYTNPTLAPTFIPGGYGGLGMGIDYQGNRLFIGNESNTVNILNLTTLAFIASIPQSVGSFSNPRIQFAFDPEGNRIFIPNTGNNTISILDYTNPTAVAATVISGFSGISGIAIDRPNNRIYVAATSFKILNYTNPGSSSASLGGISSAATVHIDTTNNVIVVATALNIMRFYNNFN